MKTLNLTLRTILLTLFLVSTTTSFAYDFVVKGIYYNINGDEATVTYMRHYQEHSVSDYYTIYDYYENDNTGDVTIPEFVTYNGKNYLVTAIGEYAFYDRYATDALTSISIPSTVTSIGNYAFKNCAGLKHITIPESVRTIGNYAFHNCYNLMDLFISESVISIGDHAFMYCSSLSNVVIPDSVTTIGNNAFSCCGGVTNLTIGKSVNSIDYGAFDNCSNLISVNCLAEVPPTVTSIDFFSNYSTPKLYVPSSSVEAYRTTYGWNYFTQVYGYGPDSFTMPDITTLHGDSIVIPISLRNESEITAFQTDIYLPEGFELVQENGEYAVSLSDRKGRDHVIMVNNAPDGALRVLSYSPTLKMFKNNEGELFYIKVKVPEGASGMFPIWLRNTILTSTDEEDLYVLDALSNVVIYDHIIVMGDVNADGIVTVSDVVTTARYILYYNPEPFIFEAADINGDSKITITDVVKIAHLVLDADYDDPTNKMNAPSNGDNIMCGDFDYNSHMVAISLNNDQDYTAFQLDLTLSMGMTASEFALTERANSLGLIVKDRGNGNVRVLGYSPDLKTITGNNGALLSFRLEGESEFLVDNIQLVTPEGLSVCPSGFVIAMDNTTSVNEQAVAKVVDHIDYYNIAGQRIDCPESGVTLTVTTYADGTRTTSKVIK